MGAGALLITVPLGIGGPAEVPVTTIGGILLGYGIGFLTDEFRSSQERREAETKDKQLQTKLRTPQQKVDESPPTKVATRSSSEPDMKCGDRMVQRGFMI